MTFADPAAMAASSRPTASRVATWFVLSLTLHAGLLMVAGPSAPRPAAKRTVALSVELRPAPTEPEAVVPAPPAAAETIPLPEAPATPVAPAETLPSPKPPAAAVERPVELMFPFDRYFSAKEVDVRAEPMNEVELIYPEKALLYRTAGSVIVTFFINEEGGVDRIELGEAKPAGVFEEAALQAAGALQFTPAQKNGRAVKSRKTIEVIFDPYSRAPAALAR